MAFLSQTTRNMRDYILNNSKNILSVFKKELHALQSKQRREGLTDKEKERLRDLSKIVSDNAE